MYSYWGHCSAKYLMISKKGHIWILQCIIYRCQPSLEYFCFIELGHASTSSWMVGNDFAWVHASRKDNGPSLSPHYGMVHCTPGHAFNKTWMIQIGVSFEWAMCNGYLGVAEVCFLAALGNLCIKFSISTQKAIFHYFVHSRKIQQMLCSCSLFFVHHSSMFLVFHCQCSLCCQHYRQGWWLTLCQVWGEGVGVITTIWTKNKMCNVFDVSIKSELYFW